MAWGSSPVASTSMAQRGGSSSTTGGIDTTGADTLVAFTWDNNGTATLSDSNTNTWTQIGTTLVVNSAFYLRMWYAKNASVGSGHTFTLSSGCVSFSIQAWAGGHLTAPQDQSSRNGNIFAASMAAGSITPSENDCLVVSAGLFRDPGGSQNAGMTEISAAGTFDEHCIEQAYKVQTTATAINPTWQGGNYPSDSTYIAAGVFSLKAAGAGGSSVKTYKGLATASVKTAKGLAIASRKTKKGLA